MADKVTKIGQLKISKKRNTAFVGFLRPFDLWSKIKIITLLLKTKHIC